MILNTFIYDTWSNLKKWNNKVVLKVLKIVPAVIIIKKDVGVLWIQKCFTQITPR